MMFGCLQITDIWAPLLVAALFHIGFSSLRQKGFLIYAEGLGKCQFTPCQGKKIMEGKELEAHLEKVHGMSRQKKAKMTFKRYAKTIAIAMIATFGLVLDPLLHGKNVTIMKVKPEFVNQLTKVKLSLLGNIPNGTQVSLLTLEENDGLSTALVQHLEGNCKSPRCDGSTLSRYINTLKLSLCIWAKKMPVYNIQIVQNNQID